MRATASLVAAVSVLLALAAGAAAAVVIYRNGFESTKQMREFVKVAEGTCTRSNARSTMSVRIGRGTLACAYRSPVLGKDIELAATGELSRKTPTRLRRAVAWAVSVRSGERSDYTLTLYPGRRRWMLSRVAGGGQGARTTLAEGRESFIHGTGARNRVALRAFEGEVVALVNNRQVARHMDPEADVLGGRQATVSIFADRVATGAVARFDSVTIRVPDP